jgi:hypothetical protein
VLAAPLARSSRQSFGEDSGRSQAGLIAGIDSSFGADPGRTRVRFGNTKAVLRTTFGRITILKASMDRSTIVLFCRCCVACLVRYGRQDAVEGALSVGGDDDKLVSQVVCVPDFALVNTTTQRKRVADAGARHRVGQTQGFRELPATSSKRRRNCHEKTHC